MMTMESERRIFLCAVLVLMICCDVNSDLIVRPADAEAVVGGTTFFNCSTTLLSSEIHWFHYVVGDVKDRSFVYGYDQFYSSYIGRFQMEKNAATGSYNLIISSVTIADAGRFECQDDTGRGDKDSAQFTVLDDNPVCQSNIKPQGLIGPNICGFEPDTLHLTCSVQYHGNQPPMMQWKEVGSDKAIVEGATRNISSDRAIHYLKVEVNSHMDGSSYQCVTTRSTQSQYGCTSDIVSVKSFSGTYIIIACVLVCLGLAIVSALAGFKIGEHTVNKREPTKTENKEQTPAPKESECTKLIDTQGKETIEKLTAENKRLLTKVKELEQQIYCSDNKVKITTVQLAHRIETKDGVKTPITGMAILDNNLFVVKKNYRVVEVYDSETFVYARILNKLDFTNPLDIASSKENKLLYVIDRENKESISIIFTFNTAGVGGKMWTTENDYGRLSTYESNLIVCFSTKRIIIEYTQEGQAVNTVRLSPGNGFNFLWHAVKLTGAHFVVSHSKRNDGQRVCVVDISGSVLMAFEKLPDSHLNVRTKDHLPIYLVGQRDEYVLVADARHRRVLRLNPTKLEFEGELIQIDEFQNPVRLCRNEAKDRLFVGIDSSVHSKSKEGLILIYNLSK